jgi:hypothetical protein
MAACADDDLQHQIASARQRIQAKEAEVETLSAELAKIEAKMKTTKNKSGCAEQIRRLRIAITELTSEAARIKRELDWYTKDKEQPIRLKPAWPEQSPEELLEVQRFNEERIARAKAEEAREASAKAARKAQIARERAIEEAREAIDEEQIARAKITEGEQVAWKKIEEVLSKIPTIQEVRFVEDFNHDFHICNRPRCFLRWEKTQRCEIVLCSGKIISLETMPFEGERGFDDYSNISFNWTPNDTSDFECGDYSGLRGARVLKEEHLKRRDRNRNHTLRIIIRTTKGTLTLMHEYGVAPNQSDDDDDEYDCDPFIALGKTSSGDEYWM